MSEIEKMYENAGVELCEGQEWVCQNPEYCTYQNLSICPENCSRCKYFEREMIYPPFTAEKQLELIKKISPAYPLNYHIKCFQGYSFEEGLAKCINNLWRYLPEEERQQIKEILE